MHKCTRDTNKSCRLQIVYFFVSSCPPPPSPRGGRNIERLAKFRATYIHTYIHSQYSCTAFGFPGCTYWGLGLVWVSKHARAQTRMIFRKIPEIFTFEKTIADSSNTLFNLSIIQFNLFNSILSNYSVKRIKRIICGMCCNSLITWRTITNTPTANYN